LNEIAIMIVGYRNPADIQQCLTSLSGMIERPAFDVFIAENGGEVGMDALLSMLDAGDFARAPAEEAPPVSPDHGLRRRSYRLNRLGKTQSFVHVAEMSENLGYAGGVNAWLRPLMKIDGWTGIWILNPDTEPRPDALARLVEHSSINKKGMVGSLIVSHDDPTIVAARGLAWRKWLGKSIAVGRNEKVSSQPDLSAIEASLTSASGASLYATRDLIERIGLMYDPYFLYCEDMEWGERAKKLGELGYAHQSLVAHKLGTTIGSSSSRVDQSALSVYLGARNSILFTVRNHPAFLAQTLAMQLFQAMRYLFQGAFWNFGFAVRGIVDGCLGKTGRPDFMSASPKQSAKV
jgi:N-acetylglucosaminyl-diphospho-decaprenol L-rhamnosyltransferase